MDSEVSLTLIGQVFSHLSAHVRCIQVNALFHFLFGQPPHLGLLPGLAAHFCFLRCGVRYRARALSLLRWQLYACKTQHAFVLSQGHTANSATSIFGSLQFEFGSMVLHFNISTCEKKLQQNTRQPLEAHMLPVPLSGKINFTISRHWCELP